MSDEEQSRATDDEASEEGPPSTPFDNPFFLPVLLWAFAVWFGYDAFFNADEHMQNASTLWFNRIGFPIVAILAAWTTFRAVREKRREREDESPAE